MKVLKDKLENNVRILHTPMPSMESTTTTVWVRTGSRFEKKEEAGISHFLEHMVFKGSKKRPDQKAVMEEIDGMGAKFNAGTSKEWTNFYIQARTKKAFQAFDLLSDIVLYPLLKNREIEKESGVILEEMAMYEDIPQAKISDIFENLIFEGDVLGEDIIGTTDTVKAFRTDDFQTYREKHYYPENILITTAGSLKWEDAILLGKKHFSEVKKGKEVEKPKVFFKQEKPKVLLKTKKTDQAHFILGFRGNERGASSRYIEALLSTVLGGSFSSRMVMEIREKRGLAYSVKTDTEHYFDNGYLATYAGVAIGKIDEAIKVMLDQYCGLAQKKYKICKEELEKAREYIKGNLALSLESTGAVNSFFGSEELLMGKTRTPDQVYKELNKVTVEDIYTLADKMFNKENLNLAIIGPYKSVRKFEGLVA